MTKLFIILFLCTLCLTSYGMNSFSSSSESNDLEEIRNEQIRENENEFELRQLIERGFADWQAYKEKHGKSYPNQDEDNERMLAYLSAKQFIEKHQRDYTEGRVYENL
uniref:Cathepsin propeptide inhibitor domain-containing protein n=1 Tax=Meloidogyne incognita TaxID=6306 RepID=A0A914MYU4_MELIC